MPFSALSAALDAARTDITVFFRDDDAGWADEQLTTLLDIFEEQRAPIDLAVIPQALKRELALDLCVRRARSRSRLGLHQHGYSHTNHETAGRKCEFGPARDAEQQLKDVKAGQIRLRALLGRVDPIFTPPWNRCTQATASALRAAGLQVLSRDHGAAALQLEGLQHLPVHVDWCKWTSTPAPDWGALDQQLALAVERADGSEPLGVMLHHAAMVDADWQALRELLGLLHDHSSVRLSLMNELIVAQRCIAAQQSAIPI